MHRSVTACSEAQALETRYFRTQPICPEDILELPPLELPEHDGSYHEFQTKRKRKEEGQMQQDAKRAQRKKVQNIWRRDRWDLLACDFGCTERQIQGRELRLVSPRRPCGCLFAQEKRMGSAANPRRAGDRTSPRSPQVASAKFAARSGHVNNGGGVPGRQPTAEPAPAQLSARGVSGNWAPPLPPPSLLAPPPPPTAGHPPHGVGRPYSNGTTPYGAPIAPFSGQVKKHHCYFHRPFVKKLSSPSYVVSALGATLSHMRSS